MDKLPRVLYVGADANLIGKLQTISADVPCRFESLSDPGRIVERLETTADDDPEKLVQFFGKRLAAIVLDVDLPAEKAAELLRLIKSHDGGIPVIMFCGRPTLISVCLARLDGAEAYFAKPIRQFEPLINSLRHAVGKLSHWQACLQLTESFALRRDGQHSQDVDASTVNTASGV